MTSRRDIVAILGPTGSGKSALALQLAKTLCAEIVNCDSVQLYRGFNIGAAKPGPDEFAAVPHHLYDVADWTEKWDAGRYASEARKVIHEINSRGKIAIIVGGTGLYFRALCGDQFDGDRQQDSELRERLQRKDSMQIRKILMRLDPKRATELHANDHYRNVRALELRILRRRKWHDQDSKPETNSRNPLTIILNPPRLELREHLRMRVGQMLAAGLVAEVEALLNAGVAADAWPLQSIGYRQVMMLLNGEITAAALADLILHATSQYAKRQRTWFAKTRSDLIMNDQFNDDEKMVRECLLLLK